jgi:hypothetical protein
MKRCHEHFLVTIGDFDRCFAESDEIFPVCFGAPLPDAKHVSRRDLYMFAVGELMDELAVEIGITGDGVVWQIHVPVKGSVFERAGKEFAFQVFLCPNDGGLGPYCHKMLQRVGFAVKAWQLGNFEVCRYLCIPYNLYQRLRILHIFFF